MAAPLRIDLNADVGEAFGAWSMGDDPALLEVVTSVNVACGFHAGDPKVMEATVGSAARAGLSVGAHPGYFDLRGFGRRAMAADPAEVEADVLYQVGALAGFARAHGTPLTHVKPHGALYNQSAQDPGLAQAIARAVARFDRSLVLVGLASSAMAREAARAEGLAFAGEAFADRRYLPDGTLAPRSEPGAVLGDPDAAAAQAVRLAREGLADTVCVHGDTPGAFAIAKAVRGALEAAGISVRALAR